MTRKLLVATLSLTALLLTGCDEPVEMPEVNDANCQHEAILKLPKSIQQEFSGLCLRRGEFKPSKPRQW